MWRRTRLTNGGKADQRRRSALKERGFGTVSRRANLDVGSHSRKDSYFREGMAGPGLGLKSGKFMLRELRLNLIVGRRHG